MPPNHKPSTRVVRAVAAAADVDPLDLPPLNDALDPDALDRLARRPEDGASALVSLTFSYAGYTVTVHGDGEIGVEEAPARGIPVDVESEVVEE